MRKSTNLFILKREVYVISSLKEDPTLDKLKFLKRLKIHEGAFLTDDIGAEDFKDALVIFDDTDCIRSKVLKTR